MTSGISIFERAGKKEPDGLICALSEPLHSKLFNSNIYLQTCTASPVIWMVTNDQQLKMLHIFLPQKHLPSWCNTVKRRPRLMENPERKIKLSKYTSFLRITRTKGHCLKRSAQRHKNISFKVSFNIFSFLNSVAANLSHYIIWYVSSTPQWIHPWQFVFRAHFRVSINLLMLKLRLS